jgi:hypothetical protein
LDLAMTEATSESDGGRQLLANVALRRDLPERGLVRSQVGTIVESLDAMTPFIEFGDDRAVPAQSFPARDALLVLRMVALAT